MELTVEEARNGRRGVEQPETAVLGDSERTWLADLRRELDGYYADVKAWSSQEPNDVLYAISGISGRLTEMRAHLLRGGQRAQKLRTGEVDPLIEELDRQFRIHSRIQAIREFELKLQGGAT